MNDKNWSLKDLETKWQSRFPSHPTPSSLSSKKKRYVLEMLPYPSGKIHMGHVRNYSIGDAMARYFLLQGFDVFHPIGWDAFGLPAENAAIDNGSDPKIWTEKNIADMKTQLQSFGFMYNWDNEIKTCSPEYYHWNQWIFREFFKRGLAYKKLGNVNFCPHCQTVLANEQVIDDRCWRCGTSVVSKKLSQWYLKITEYAQKLFDQHELLKNHWPDRVLNMQKRWIEPSQGTEITFPVRGYEDTLTVFTTSIETLFGVTFLALAYDHPWLEKIFNILPNPDVELFIKDAKKDNSTKIEEQLEKNGIFTGFFALHPITGDPIPIYIANYVHSDYGLGAVMGVPAHDSRDFEFAKKYDIPLVSVVEDPKNEEEQTLPLIDLNPEYLLIRSNEFSGLSLKEAKENILEKLEKENKAKPVVNYKLRDWLISRQRYWGTPIPIINCPSCGPVLVPEKDLPVILPTDVQFEVGKNPLLTSESFLHIPCPECGEMATRESDTMDTFFDSSWYFLRYLDPHNTEAIFSKEKAFPFLPVNIYVGGIEHAVLHLLYARFFYLALGDMGLTVGKEPFENLITQGMVLSFSYYCPECKAYYNKKDLVYEECPKGHRELTKKMEKMSKSKNNGIEPQDLIDTYGADASRLFVLFAAPLDKDLEWNEQGVVGCYRFLKRILNYASEYSAHLIPLPYTEIKETPSLLKAMHKTIASVTKLMESFSYNTAIAKLMEFLNTLEDFTPKEEKDFGLLKSLLSDFSLLLFPLAPHIAMECYALVWGEDKSIFLASFPTFKEEFLKEDSVIYSIQHNGKMKGTLEVSLEKRKEEIESLVKDFLTSKKVLENQSITKIIFVEGKMVNFVTKPL